MRNAYPPVDGRALPWVAVASQVHREDYALHNLARQGYIAYCPRIWKRVKHARKVKDVLRPLFPGYMFVEIDPLRTPWRSIHSTFGVRSIVHFGTRLGLLDAGFIASLRAREIDGAVARPMLAWAVGQQIRIAGGPFDNLVGEIIELDEKDRLVVLMQMLNQSVKVKLSAGQVAPV